MATGSVGRVSTSSDQSVVYSVRKSIDEPSGSFVPTLWLRIGWTPLLYFTG